MKRNPVLIVLVAIALIAFGSVDGYAQTPVRDILRRMDDHNKRLTTLQATITVVTENTQLKDEPEVRRGSLIYAKAKKDALVRIDWQKPEESMSSMDGRYVLFQRNNKTAYTGLVSEAKPERGGFVFGFMKMSKSELNASYSVAYLGEGTLSDGTRTFHLQLTPKTKASYSSAEIWVDSDGMVRQAKTVEGNSTTTLLLSGLKKNQKLKKSSFQISLPKDTQVKKT